MQKCAYVCKLRVKEDDNLAFPTAKSPPMMFYKNLLDQICQPTTNFRNTQASQTFKQLSVRDVSADPHCVKAFRPVDIDSWTHGQVTTNFGNKQDHGDVKGVGWRCICMYFPTKLLLLRTPTRGLFVGPCDTHLFLFKKLTGWALQLVENKKRRHACIFAAT